MGETERVSGVVLKNYSGFYYVQTADSTIYECKLRGKIKEQIVTGDRVIITPLVNDKGVLENLEKRDNLLYRPKIANVDLLLIVMAYDQPIPSLSLLDRLIMLANYNRLKPIIILNKSDIKAHENTNLILNYYPRAGFKVISVSAYKQINLNLIDEEIKDNIAVMAGPSGVGKSSLLNALSEKLDIKTQTVSSKIGRGRHTTRHVELYPLRTSGWLADTPGFSVLDMPVMKSSELSAYFPDFEPYFSKCRFNNCLHNQETECGVKQAVTDGIILSSRYQNYLQMLQEVIQKERCYK
ncbi:MAG: ribosome small subunit-dependent GTPase A [Syntrophomonadaceae bacterium]|nr:ribosome small subunit-dependent GTPase A [Syntrophomonadaceae bacterium]